MSDDAAIQQQLDHEMNRLFQHFEQVVFPLSLRKTRAIIINQTRGIHSLFSFGCVMWFVNNNNNNNNRTRNEQLGLQPPLSKNRLRPPFTSHFSRGRRGTVVCNQHAGKRAFAVVTIFSFSGSRAVHEEMVVMRGSSKSFGLGREPVVSMMAFVVDIFSPHDGSVDLRVLSECFRPTCDEGEEGIVGLSYQYKDEAGNTVHISRGKVKDAKRQFAHQVCCSPVLHIAFKIPVFFPLSAACRS
jgi:hypothetical protein